MARLPAGVDPGDLAEPRPAALAAAVDGALPFLGFRVDRVLGAARLTSNEGRAAAAEAAMAVVNEHPNELVRRQYAVEVAVRCGLPPDDLVAMAAQQTRRPRITVVAAPARARGHAGDDGAGGRPRRLGRCSPVAP